LRERDLFEVVGDVVVVCPEELDEDTVWIAEEDCLFGWRGE